VIDAPAGEEIAEEVSEEESPQVDLEHLKTLGTTLLKTRKEAIEARKTSGIEDVWREDEEHYEGVDDANRHTAAAVNSKPPGQAYPKTSQTNCVAFFNITRPYVDAAAAKVGDILLPTDDRAWSLGPTPIPDLIDVAQKPMPQAIKSALAQGGMTPEQIQQEETQAADKARAVILQAKEKAKKAEKRIEDWQVEGQWHAEMRKVIDDCTRLGSGVLKGPMPVLKKCQAWIEGKVVLKEEIKPVSKRISCWDFFPHGSCGESIHNGNYTWEVDRITPKQLEDLKDDPSYIAEEIDKCITEKPINALDRRKTTDGKELTDKDQFEIWYYHGFVSREDLEASGCQCPEGDAKSVPAIFTIVNNRVIKGALNPLDKGEFPYDVMPWQRRVGMPWGSGVGRQIRTPQELVNGAGRTMIDNASRGAGPMLIIKKGVIAPADGVMGITPWKVFYADSNTEDVSKAFTLIEIPSMTEKLMQIIQWGMKLAEDVTGLPLLLQGQAGAAPETLGGQQLVDRNASGVLRRIARTIDDNITEPHTRRYYAWLLQYGDDEEKGEYVIDARGSTSFAEREINKEQAKAMLEASLNPAFELSPKKAMEEFLRAQGKDPKDYQLTDEEKEAAAKQQEQGDQSAQISLEVAKIKTEADKQLEQFKAQEAEKQRQFDAAEKAKDREHERAIRDAELQIEMVQFAREEQISIAEAQAKVADSLNKSKTTLADTAMKLRTQKELAHADHAAAQVADAAIEPPGRAPEGQAFQK
jgi:hypothetical protein